MRDGKIPYICGPLTELPLEQHQWIKSFYSSIADICKEVLGVRAFVPHENYDPVNHPHYTPAEVDCAERAQVCERTSLLIVVTLAPSWGGGIEVEMANQHGVPVWLVREDNRNISRLLRGNPAVRREIRYPFPPDALTILRHNLKEFREEMEKAEPEHVLVAGR